MIPQTQSRTGKHGRCFAASIASILEIPESEIPEWVHEDTINKWLTPKFGLFYQQVPFDRSNPPKGYSTIEGISPRGGPHACVAHNGQLVFDPHPRDGTGRGLVTVQNYGVLRQSKKRAADMISPLTSATERRAKDTGNYMQGNKRGVLSQYPENSAQAGKWNLKKYVTRNGKEFFESSTVHPNREHAEAYAKKSGHSIAQAGDRRAKDAKGNLQIVIAWTEESQDVDEQRSRNVRRDLGEALKFKAVTKPFAAMWLNKGNEADVAKAKAYASGEGKQVFVYTGIADPLGRAKQDVMRKSANDANADGVEEFSLNYFKNGKYDWGEPFTGTLAQAKNLVNSQFSKEYSAMNIESKSGRVLYVVGTNKKPLSSQREINAEKKRTFGADAAYRDRMHRALDRAIDADNDRTFTIKASGSPEFIDALERQLAYLQWCGSVGHSCTVGISIDGDGSDRMKVEGISDKVKINEGDIVTRREPFEQLKSSRG